MKKRSNHLLKKILPFFLLTTNLWALDFDETLVQTPLKESNEVSLFGRGCISRNQNIWDLCYTISRNNDYTPASFRFKNAGPNPIVTEASPGMKGREFDFMFEDMARSDLGLLVWDFPSDNDNESHLKMLFFFPRVVLPAIKHHMTNSEDILVVTLPTEEEVIFDAKTYEIISGALTESPLKIASNGKAVAPNVQYSGKGVVIEASAQANWPIGVVKNPTRILSSKNATIKKVGYKNCIVPSKDIWFTDTLKNDNVMFKKNIYSN